MSAEIVFIQSKTSKNFETKEIGNFGWAVNDFISEKPQISWSKIALEKIKLLNKLFENSSVLREKPRCHLFYVTLGIVNKTDQNIVAKVEEIKRNIGNENLFESIKFDLIGVNEIHAQYKKIGQAVTKSFEFPCRVTLPEINGVTEAYLGIIDGSIIIQLMTDEDGELIPNVFYDNVRDFQGENNVNKEIQMTLKTADKQAFVVLNNGVTIVAETLQTSRDKFTISNYQITITRRFPG